MKTFTTSQQNKLNQNVTPYVMAVKIVLVNGLVIGLTDLDHTINVDGVSYSPQQRLTEISQVTETIGTSIGEIKIAGVLHLLVSGQELLAGMWNHAEVTVFMFDPNERSDQHILKFGWIGEHTTSDLIFTTEIRDLKQALNQQVGRKLLSLCDANVFDSRCGASLGTVDTDGAFLHSGEVVSVTSQSEFVCTIETDLQSSRNEVSAWYDLGFVTWQTGGNARTAIGSDGISKTFNLFRQARNHTWSSPNHTIQLIYGMVFEIAEGDTFYIYPGCNKRGVGGHCQTKFFRYPTGFRGHEFVPTEDLLNQVPKGL